MHFYVKLLRVKMTPVMRSRGIYRTWDFSWRKQKLSKKLYHHHVWAKIAGKVKEIQEDISTMLGEIHLSYPGLSGSF